MLGVPLFTVATEIVARRELLIHTAVLCESPRRKAKVAEYSFPERFPFSERFLSFLIFFAVAENHASFFQNEACQKANHQG